MVYVNGGHCQTWVVGGEMFHTKISLDECFLFVNCGRIQNVSTLRKPLLGERKSESEKVL